MTRLLTLREVTRMTALSRSAVYALMAGSRFPKPIRIGSRAVRWVEKEVLDFIASRPRGGSERPAAHRSMLDELLERRERVRRLCEGRTARWRASLPAPVGPGRHGGRFGKLQSGQ